MATLSAADKLLDFTQPFDVALLDATVATFYGSSNPEEVRAPPACGPRWPGTARASLPFRAPVWPRRAA